MSRTLITGASGFVGANLARRLLANGHEVHLLMRPGYQPWRIRGIQPHVQIHEVNMLDSPALRRLVSLIRPEWVFHLAAHGAYSWQDDLQAILDTNLHSTIHLLNACLRSEIQAFIHAGSSSEYGIKDHAPAESEAPEPNSHYAVAKAAATMYCQFVARRDTAPVTTLRLYSAYGPYEEPQRLIPTLVRHGFKGEYPPLVSPDIARDYVHVDDVVEAFIMAAIHAPKNPGAIYNIGSGRQTSLREVVTAVRQVMNISAEPVWGSMPSRKWDTTVWVANPDLALKEIGWAATLPFAAGFMQTVEWFHRKPGMLERYYQRAGDAV